MTTAHRKLRTSRLVFPEGLRDTSRRCKDHAFTPRRNACGNVCFLIAQPTNEHQPATSALARSSRNANLRVMPAPYQQDLADVVEKSDRHPRTRRNFRMQYRLAVHTLIPWLEKLGVLPDQPAVCEIGCGEGGVIAAFVERGTTKALGTDIVGLLLELVSEPIARDLNLKVEYAAHDVIGDAIQPEWEQAFDVVVLRDVIEHLDDPAAAMRAIRRIMKPTGVLLITFPPYTSPFGGHQQLLGTTLGNIPFIHLLPSAVFERVIANGDPVNQDEVRRLHAIRCSVRGVKNAATSAGLSLLDERYFGLRPVFRWKYSKPIPTLEITRLRWLPLVQSLAMEAAFIFRIEP